MGQQKICTSVNLLCPITGPQLPSETQYLLRRPIGPRGPREIKEDPGASGKAIKGETGNWRVKGCQPNFGHHAREKQGTAGLADLGGSHMLEILGGRPKTYGNLGRLNLGLKGGFRNNQVAP